VIPPPRLTKQDLYHQIDWLKAGWITDHEQTTTKRLQRLQAELSTFHRKDQARLEQAQAHLDQLAKARLSNSIDWQAQIALLRLHIAQTPSRPLYVCNWHYDNGTICQITHKSPQALADHRQLVHSDQ
jgi:hypothetical protein